MRVEMVLAVESRENIVNGTASNVRPRQQQQQQLLDRIFAIFRLCLAERVRP